jgi:hypothetical protein
LNIFLFAISGYELELDSHSFEKNKTFIRSSSAVQIARDSETLLLVQHVLMDSRFGGEHHYRQNPPVRIVCVLRVFEQGPGRYALKSYFLPNRADAHLKPLQDK